MSLEKIQLLEEKVSEILQYIKTLQEEKADLTRRLQEAEQRIEEYKKMEEEFNRMKEERGEVRSRIERLLEDLQGFKGESSMEGM